LTTSQQIDELLGKANAGHKEALDKLMNLVYEDLRRLATSQLQRQPGRVTPTLQPTELANETYLRLLKQRRRFDNKGHFFAIATKVMLRVLLDHRRAGGAAKRGGERVRVTLTGLKAPAAPDPTGDVAAFTTAIEKLASLDSTTADVVKLRILWGLTNVEIAGSLDLSLRTVEREWRFARKWLMAELEVDSGTG